MNGNNSEMDYKIVILSLLFIKVSRTNKIKMANQLILNQNKKF